MPTSIKLTILCLVLSLVAMLLADYADSLLMGDYALVTAAILGLDVFWGLVMLWIMSDVYRKKNVTLSLYAVSAVMIYFLVTDIMESGFAIAQAFHALEILFFLIPVYLLKRPDAKLWYQPVNS